MGYGYDPDLRIVLSKRRDCFLNLVLKPDENGVVPNIEDVFPTGTTISLRFYADKQAVIDNNEITGTAITPTIEEWGVAIRIESTVGDLIPVGAQARLFVDYPSSFPNGDNLPWGKCKVERDD